MRDAPLDRLKNTLFSLQSTSVKLRLMVGGICTVLIVALIAWSILADLPLLIPAQAVVGSEQEAQNVVAMIDGAVIASEVNVGDIVDKGAVLVKLDPSLARKKRDDALKEVTYLQQRIDEARMRQQALRAELAQVRNLESDEEDELSAQAEEKRLDLSVAKSQLEAIQSLEGAAPMELRNAETAYKAALLIYRAWRARMQQGPMVASQLLREIEQRIYALARELSELETTLVDTQTKLQQAEEDLKRHDIHAPIAGRVLAFEAPAVGGGLLKGSKIAQIEPLDASAVVATVESEQSGKIKAGQRCWLELDSYPPLRYGRILCKVKAVIKSGSLQGEVRLLAHPDLKEKAPSHRKMLEKGNTGVLYIEVERLSPLELLLEQLT